MRSYRSPSGSVTLGGGKPVTGDNEMSLAFRLLSVAALSAGLLVPATYYPASESAGGWRRCGNDDEVRSQAGLDAQQLRLIGQTQGQGFCGAGGSVSLWGGCTFALWVG